MQKRILGSRETRKQENMEVGKHLSRDMRKQGTWKQGVFTPGYRYTTNNLKMVGIGLVKGGDLLQCGSRHFKF